MTHKRSLDSIDLQTRTLKKVSGITAKEQHYTIDNQHQAFQTKPIRIQFFQSQARIIQMVVNASLLDSKMVSQTLNMSFCCFLLIETVQKLRLMNLKETVLVKLQE